MPKRLNLIGQRFGRLLVLETAGSQQGHSFWLCQCECGNTIKVVANSLRRGLTKSCKCLTSEITATRNRRHGFAKRGNKSKTYKIWEGMTARCHSSSATGYKFYGGKGIRVCERWHTFADFLKDMGECPVGYSIERKISTGNYELENCLWLPLEKQNNNKKNTKFLTINGETKRLTEWSRELKIPYTTLWHRNRKNPAIADKIEAEIRKGL